MSTRTRNALPDWYACRRGGGRAPRRHIKAASNAAMRARERAARDALRHGADPDAATMPTRPREVADRWAVD